MYKLLTLDQFADAKQRLIAHQNNISLQSTKRYYPARSYTYRWWNYVIETVEGGYIPKIREWRGFTDEQRAIILGLPRIAGNPETTAHLTNMIPKGTQDAHV